MKLFENLRFWNEEFWITTFESRIEFMNQKAKIFEIDEFEKIRVDRVC